MNSIPLFLLILIIIIVLVCVNIYWFYNKVNTGALESFTCPNSVKNYLRNVNYNVNSDFLECLYASCVMQPEKPFEQVYNSELTRKLRARRVYFDIKRLKFKRYSNIKNDILPFIAAHCQFLKIKLRDKNMERIKNEIVDNLPFIVSFLFDCENMYSPTDKQEYERFLRAMLKQIGILVLCQIIGIRNESVMKQYAIIRPEADLYRRRKLKTTDLKYYFLMEKKFGTINKLNEYYREYYFKESLENKTLNDAFENPTFSENEIHVESPIKKQQEGPVMIRYDTKNLKLRLNYKSIEHYNFEMIYSFLNWEYKEAVTTRIIKDPIDKFYIAVWCAYNYFLPIDNIYKFWFKCIILIMDQENRKWHNEKSREIKLSKAQFNLCCMDRGELKFSYEGIKSLYYTIMNKDKLYNMIGSC